MSDFLIFKYMPNFNRHLDGSTMANNCTLIILNLLKTSTRKLFSSTKVSIN